jgi:hypothetical protein
MGLESYHGEARAALASFLAHAVNQEGRLYGALLPEQHPFSFCQLLGLTFQELKCLFFACGFVTTKKGMSSLTFLPQAFHEFLSATPNLNSIHGSRTAVKNYNNQRHYIYSIGDFSLSKAASRIFGKQETALENGSLQPVHFHPRHRVHIKALVEHLLSLPADEEENSEGGDIEDSEGCDKKKEENMGVEAAVSASEPVALEQSTLEEEAWEQEARASAATKKHSREDVTYPKVKLLWVSLPCVLSGSPVQAQATRRFENDATMQK